MTAWYRSTRRVPVHDDSALVDDRSVSTGSEATGGTVPSVTTRPSYGQPLDARPRTARPLNATAASLLGLLHDGPMTGWELVNAAQKRIGEFWTLTQSQVYRELAAMAADGLVEVGPPGPRDRKPHGITEPGRAAFTRWLGSDPAADQIRIPLLLTVAFAAHLPAGRLAEVISAQRDEHERRLAGYRAAREPVPQPDAPDAAPNPARRATLEYGLRHEQAVLDWLDELPRLLGLPDDRSP